MCSHTPEAQEPGKYNCIVLSALMTHPFPSSLFPPYPPHPQDVIEFRPKYRPMSFELRVYPHDHYATSEGPYATPELLLAQDTLVSEVVELLCNSS